MSLAYKYNGKELQETDMYDYGWRQYLPDIGRWNGMDQLAEAYTSISPYAYVANNPAMLTDPDGRWIDDEGNMTNKSGQTTFLLGPSYQPLLTMGSHGVMTNPFYANYSNPVSGGDRGFGQVFLDWFIGLFRNNKKGNQPEKALASKKKATLELGEITGGFIDDALDGLTSIFTSDSDTFYQDAGGGNTDPILNTAFRPGKDKNISVNGYFGGMLTSLAFGQFDRNMTLGDKLLGAEVNLTGFISMFNFKKDSINVTILDIDSARNGVVLGKDTTIFGRNIQQSNIKMRLWKRDNSIFDKHLFNK